MIQITSRWLLAGYWGMPVVSVSVFVGMVAAVMASILESIGDYFAMAGVCEEPPPPQHAVNRGIAVEGLSSLISGLLGACHATTSYSEVVGMVAMTGVSYSSQFRGELARQVCHIVPAGTERNFYVEFTVDSTWKFRFVPAWCRHTYFIYDTPTTIMGVSYVKCMCYES